MTKRVVKSSKKSIPSAIPKTARERAALVRWARAAIRGVDQSTFFVGVLDDRPLDAAKVDFEIQLGHAVLTDKPIIIPAPMGMELPVKLVKVADEIVRYDPEDMSTIQTGIELALARMGIRLKQ